MSNEIPEGWEIEYNPKPIPSRQFDYDWAHIDYCGARDSGDARCGTSESVEDAVYQINEIIQEAERVARLDEEYGCVWKMPAHRRSELSEV